MAFGILDVFKDDDWEQQNDGNYKVECPHCGLQGKRTKGFILFPDGNRAYCHSSGKHFNILEAYALRQKLIQCNDGRDKGDKGFVLTGDTFIQTCDHFRNNHGDTHFNEVANMLNLKEEIELPGIISKFAVQLSKKIGSKNVIFWRPELNGVYEISKVKHVDGTVEYTGFVELSPSRFVTLTENYFNPWKKIFNKQGEMIKYESMTQTTAKIVIDSDHYRYNIPIINRIFNTPIPIIHDGKLTFPKIGYDERFGSWLPSNSPKIDTSMTLDEAVKLLKWVYHEFCFTDKEEDMGRAIAGLLTPFLKGLFPTFNTRTPIFVYTANRERSGKDYCAGVTGIVFEGIVMEDPPFSDGERTTTGKNDELKKKILAVLMQGRQRYHSSNNKGLLNSAVLESISTAERFSERELGKNKTHAIDNEMFFSLSGNTGMTFTADLMNRAIFVDLFLDLEDANKRKFDTPNLHGWLKKNREKVLSALYALVRNWVEKGQPKGSEPFASFPVWAEICGGIMESAGFPNPCKRSQNTVIVDNATQQMKTLFELGAHNYEGEWLSKKDIKELIQTHNSDENNEGLYPYMDWNDRSDVTKFWKNFKRYIGRFFSGIRLDIKPSSHSSRDEYMFVKTVKDEPKSDEKPVEGDPKKCPPVHLLPPVKSHIKDKIQPQNVDKRGQVDSFEAQNDGQSFIKETPKSINTINPTNGKTSKKGPDTPKSVNVVNVCQHFEIVKFPIKENLEPKNVDKRRHVDTFEAQNGQSFIKETPKSINPIKNDPIISDGKTSKKAEFQPKMVKKDDKPKEKAKIGVGTDREVQFYDPECWDTSDMGVKCSEDDVKIFIKENPGNDYKELYGKLGDGVGLHISNLMKDKKIEKRDGKYYGI